MDSTPIGFRSPGSALVRLTLLITAVLLGGLAWSGCGGTEQPQELTGMTRRPPLNVAPASLPQTNPKRSAGNDRLKGPKDGLMLLYFGYTFCPDVCPTTLADLRLALAKLDPEQRSRVEVAMVTVDPKRDRPQVMNRYMGHFFPDGNFASFVPDSQAQLAPVERTFGVSHRYGKPDRNGNYEVEHSAQVFAIDGTGQVLVEWPFGSNPENVAADIRLLLDRIDQNQTNESEQT